MKYLGLNAAQKREACARYGHRPEPTPRGVPPAWYCRRCGDLVAKR